jgi:3,4-dihydroxy 2-butanone 4-phosphate synthase/GTP cyclohydrolase II
MTLSEYLKAHETSASRFATVLGVPPSTILRVLKGERVPGLELMRKIAEATGNAVTPNDFAGTNTPPVEAAE